MNNDILTIRWGVKAPVFCRDNNQTAFSALVSYKILNDAVKEQCEDLILEELDSFMFYLVNKYNTAAEVINGANFNELISYHQNSSNATNYEIISAEFNSR